MLILSPLAAVFLASICGAALLACYVAVQMAWPPLESYPAWVRAAFAFLLFGASGYAAFFAALASVDAFLAVKSAYFALVLAFLVAGAIKQYYGRREVGLTVGFVMLVVLYASIVFAIGRVGDPTALTAARFTHLLPIDNVLPKILADQLLNGAIRIPMLGDWHASDRPPLQAGLYALLRPAPGKFSYQVLSMSFQLLSLPALAILLRAVGGLSIRVYLWTLAAVAISPPMLMFATFVWPKLLAAAFALIATAFAVGYFRGEAGPRLAGIGIGLASGLSFAAHGGTAFYLLGMGLSALIVLRIPLKIWLGAAVTFFAVYLPWAAFQKFIDPPGDRLLKWMLAGHIPPTERSFLDVLSSAYAGLTAEAWLQGRLDNLKTIGAGAMAHTERLASVLFAWEAVDADRLDQTRGAEFFELLSSQQLLLIAGIAAVIVNLALRRPWRREYVFLVAALVTTIAVWAVLMFTPASTLNHAGALAVNVLLTALLALAVGSLDWRALAAIVCLTALLNFKLYILKGAGHLPVNWMWVGVAALCLSALCLTARVWLLQMRTREEAS